MKYYLVLLFFIVGACKAQSVTEKVTFSSLPAATQNYDSARLIGIEKIGNLWQNKLFFGYQFGAKTVVATVAGLRSTTSVRSDEFYILPDGSIWVWNPSDVSSDDGCVTVKATAINTGRFNRSINDYVYSKWYLNANDTSDQSASIQKWLDAAFRLGKDAYHNKSVGIVYAKNILPKVSITGDIGAAFKTHSTATYDNNLIWYNNIGDFYVKNISLYGNKGVVPGNVNNGVTLMRLSANTVNKPRYSNVVIDGVKFYNNGYLAVSIASMDNVEVRNTLDSNTDCHVIAFGNCDAISIHDNISYGGGGTSEKFSLWGDDSLHTVTNASVFRNRIIGTDFGISIRYARTYDISKNFLDHVKYNAIYRSTQTQFISIDTMGNNRGIIDGNIMYHCGRGITGPFSNATISNNFQDSLDNNSIGFDIGSTAYKCYNVNLINNTVKNPGNNGMGVWLRNISSGLVQNMHILEQRTPALMSQGVSLLNCDNIKILYCDIDAGTYKRLNADSCTKLTIYDLNGDIRLGNAVTNSNVLMCTGTISNTSATNLITYTGANTPNSILASAGSIWRTTSGVPGSSLYVNESGTTTWTPFSTGTAKMTTAQRIALISPADGLSVYDTDLHKLFINENGTWVQK